jgi:F-type H+-transporting ATPase subunit delta
MKDSRINIRYATALFDLALEQQILDRVFEDMKMVKNICLSNKDFEMLLSSPIVRTDKKQAIVKEIFGNHIHNLSLSFLLLILKKRREANIKMIAFSFIAMFKESKNIKIAHLKTAIELDSKTKEHFKAILTEQTHKSIELVEEVNPDLIGGFVITIDDKQADNSIYTKIQRLRKEFNVNIYEKGF